MTAPKPDLAAAARQLNALVERMQECMLQYVFPTGDASPLEARRRFTSQVADALDGPELRAAQGALKAALAEVEPPLCASAPRQGDLQCCLPAEHDGEHCNAREEWR